MSTLQLRVASKKKVKIKMAISAPTGFGKTYSALLLAYGITNNWQRIAVIDSENESADLYSDLGEYNVISMKPPYNVDSFEKAVKLCQDAGIEVCIVDSTYHYWHGKGGLLEYNQSLGGRYQDWAKTNPLYARWLNAILQTPMHFICTSRKKQAYEMTKDAQGKIIVEKKGMEDEIRSGFDYEMTLAFDITNDQHMAKASKDRTGLYMNKQEFVINQETGKEILEWCNKGIELDPPIDPISEAMAEIYLAVNENELKATWSKWKQYQADSRFMKAKDEMKVKLSQPVTSPAPVTEPTKPATTRKPKWQLTPDLKNELEILLMDATLDATGKDAASLAINGIKTEADFEKIKVRLIELQPAGV